MLAASSHRAGWIPAKKINKIATVQMRPTGPVTEAGPGSVFRSGSAACEFFAHSFITVREAILMAASTWSKAAVSYREPKGLKSNGCAHQS